MKKRGVLTIDLYVYGESDEEIIEESDKIVKELNDEYDCNARITTLKEMPFARKIGKEITNLK